MASTPTMVQATRCHRLELWTSLQCAAGRRLAIWPSVLAAAMTLTLGLDSSCTVQVPLDAEATTLLARWQVVRVWETDTRWDEWVVTDVVRDDRSNVATLTMAWPTVLLGRSGFVQERTPDGRVRLELDRVGLPPVTLLDTLVLAPLASQGLTWVQRGVVTPTAVQDLSLAWATPLQALTRLVEVCGAELQLRRVGVRGYAVDLLERIGAGTPVLGAREALNLLEFSQSEALSEHATVVLGKGAAVDGESATIADAVWRVAAVTGNDVVLEDAIGGGPGPIGFDAQLNGLALERPTGTRVAITRSVAGTQRCTLATTPSLTVGDLVRVVEADGADVVALRCPVAIDDFGVVVGTLERSDLPGHRNLVPNAVGRTWTGGPSTAPDGWSAIGAPTLLRLTSGAQITRGPAALQVTTAAADAGLRTPSATLVPTETRPFLSGYFELWVLSGQVRVELVATTATGTLVYPTGGALATSTVLGQSATLGLAGIDARGAGLLSAYLRVVQHGTTAASWVVMSAQLTMSAAQLPFVEGSGGTQLWQACNARLETSAIPRLRTSISLVDLARLNPMAFAADQEITLGGTARVVIPRRAIDGTARIVRVERDLLVPGRCTITLSDQPKDLTGSLARVTWRPRPTPAAPIVVAPGELRASTAFDGSGALTILVTAPDGTTSIRAAVSTSGIPSVSTVDAATGTLRVDGTDVAALTAAGPFTAGQLVYIAVRAYRAGVGTRVLQLTDAADAADTSQGPSLEVRVARTDTEFTIRYAAIGTLIYRVNDTVTALPASPFTVARPAALADDLVLTFLCTRNGATVSETITVYPLGVDTVTPDLTVVPVSIGASRETLRYTVSATDPSGRGLTLTRRMLLTGCTATGFSGAGPHTLTDGQTVEIQRPLARNDGVVVFECLATGGGRAAQTFSVPAQDLTGLGVEVLSNPEFRSDLPRRAAVYDNLASGRITLAYVSETGQNSTGTVLEVTKAAGAVDQGAGGAALLLTRTTAVGWVADAYREGTLYLVTVRAKIPVGWTLSYASNAFGTGGATEWLSAQAGTGTYADYTLRVQIGTGGSFSPIGFFYLTGADNTAAVTWRIARINWRDLQASQRLAPVAVTARITDGGDADTSVVEVVASPATSDTKVWLAAASETPEAGAAIGVEVANGSTWNLPRRAFRTGVGHATFQARTPGFEVGVASVEIPEQGRDTVPLRLTATRTGGDAGTDVVRLVAIDPYPQGPATIQLAIALGGAPASSPAGPTFDVASGEPVDITIDKPAEGGQPARVVFTASNANRVSATDAMDIQPIASLIPGRIEFLALVQAGDDVVLRFRAYRRDGVEVTSPGALAGTLTSIPLVGAATSSSLTITRDTVNGWFEVTVTRTKSVGYAARLVLTVAGTAPTEATVTIPTNLDPTPRFTNCKLTRDTVSPWNIVLTFTATNAPSGAAYVVTFTQGGASTTIDPVTNGAVIASGSPAPAAIRGELTMLDSTRTVLTKSALPTTILT